MDSMVEILQALAKILKDLPDMALWVLTGFFVYKALIYTSTVAAVVFCIKFVTSKIHEAVLAKIQAESKK